MNRVWRRTRHIDKRTLRLALSYLAVMMLVSVTFSVVLFATSASALHVNESTTTLQPTPGATHGSPSSLPPLSTPTQDLKAEAASLLGTLLMRLVILNVLVLAACSGLSYYLARRTLRPIEMAMEMQTRFFSDASHELRTPLTALRIRGEVALRDPQLALPEAKEALESNVQQAIKLETLANNLLKLAQGNDRQIDPMPVGLSDIVNETVSQLRDSARAKNIIIDCAVPAIVVMGDRQQLTQVVVILLDNAIKFSSAGNTIWIRGQSTKNEGQLSIRDEGPGIAATDLPHIFERFYQADRSRAMQGYGLGLSIAKQIVERHHGRIVVKSTVGEGSTFTMSLPLANAAKGAPARG